MFEEKDTVQSRFDKFKDKYRAHMKAAALGVSLGVAVGVTIAVKDRLDITHRLHTEVSLLHRENEILSNNQINLARVLEKQGLINNLSIEDL